MRCYILDIVSLRPETCKYTSHMLHNNGIKLKRRYTRRSPRILISEFRHLHEDRLMYFISTDTSWTLILISSSLQVCRSLHILFLFFTLVLCSHTLWISSHLADFHILLSSLSLSRFGLFLHPSWFPTSWISEREEPAAAAVGNLHYIKCSSLRSLILPPVTSIRFLVAR